ncbi:Protein XRI1 [Zea mays]|uniref:Protein XRI1 n=1 Tax=Zea mays TaxID=4577 RepID=A0A1D6J5E6_MAIZE|nr:Protein XRI1 [Zea mays]AQK43163.1 Protein XRI1 [Zea mays]
MAAPPPPVEAPTTMAKPDATKFVWDCLNQDDDELMGLLGNQTPLRDCRDFFADLGDFTCKETLDLEESRESKRRRTLEYPSESSQSEVGTHDAASPFVTSEAAEISLLCTDKPQSLNWDMHHTSNNLGTSETGPMTESFIMQETRKLCTLKVSKGSSSTLVKVKENLTTSVAYPFTLIKPSWEEGDVTLQDINQRIRAPPKKAPEILGTSAFSGKPVIGKTRIRTEGGKGSITILRTKG